MTRGRRWCLFEAAFPEIEDLSVLDLGGTAATWTTSPIRPRSVTCLNLDGVNQHAEAQWIQTHAGDACDPAVAELVDEHDLVFSNSVIEHVGGYAKRLAFAANVRRARRYWVQTPNRYFPVEPHWLFPGLQFLPVPVRALIVSRWSLGWGFVRDQDRREVIRRVLEVELIGAKELQYYFPDAELTEERFAGLAKSLVALRR